jgi:hypothetical protein
MQILCSCGNLPEQDANGMWKAWCYDCELAYEKLSFNEREEARFPLRKMRGSDQKEPGEDEGMPTL